MRQIKIKYIAIFLLTLLIEILAQPTNSWQKTFGGDQSDDAFSVKQTSDGGFILVGDTQSFGVILTNVYIIKTDSSGNKIWEKNYGGIDHDHGESVIETTEGNYLVAGYTYNTPNFYPQIYVLNLNENGDTIWTKMYGGPQSEYGSEIIQTLEGGFVIVGESDSYGAGKYDIFLVKINGQGDTLWTKTYGSTEDDYGSSAQQTIDGGFIIAGGTDKYGSRDIYLIKTNTDGDSVWTKIFITSIWDIATSVRQTTDGGYIISGYSYNTGNSDAILIKTDENGDTIWTKTYGGSDDDRAFCVQEIIDGGYIFTGVTTLSGSHDVSLIKTDNLGNQIWLNTFGGAENDVGYSLDITADSMFIIVGRTESFGAGGFDVYLIKADDTPPVSEINVIYPNGGEIWIQGLTEEIIWSSQNISDVKIELSIDNGINWNTIISSTPSDGSFLWDVNSPLNSNECLIKISDVTDSSIYDFSDSIFTIESFTQTGELVSLTIGNKWFYDYIYFSSSPSGTESDHRIEIKEIVGDTILSKPYKKVFVTSIGETNTTYRMEYWGLDSIKFYHHRVHPLGETGLDTFFDLRIVNDTSWLNIAVSVYLSSIWDSLRTFQKWVGDYSGMASGEERTITVFGVGPIDIYQDGFNDTGGSFWWYKSYLYGAVIDEIVYGDTSTVLGINYENVQPDQFLLSQNYPNPFNPSTKINYQLPEISFVALKIYDVLGNEIATLVNEEKSAGSYEVEFSSKRLPSGIYFYQLRAGNYVETKKMVLLR